jgi:protein-L-isoaspartate(D-aspartate) O-methyltransferase
VDELQGLRAAYARSVVAEAGSDDAALIEAFAAVPREDFVGPPPWRIHSPSGFLDSPTDDARLLYQDVLVALLPERGINNGQPSLHARCLAALRLERGDAVIHVGAGSGYYTAIIAQLVGARGRVDAYEIEPVLAAQAAMNLRPWPQARLHAQSALGAALPQGVDAIYVSAGATHPPAAWLDALGTRGRLLLPLTAGEGSGAMLLATRRPSGRYAAHFLARVAFIPCIGAHDDADARALAATLRTRRLTDVRSLVRDDAPDASAWHVGRGWWLSTTPVDEPG